MDCERISWTGWNVSTDTALPFSPRWLQHQPLRPRPLDLLPAEEQREVPSLGPEGQQIAVVGASGLPGLAGDVGGHRMVPVSRVQDLPERGSMADREIGADPDVQGVAVAAALHGWEPEDRPALTVR